MTPSLKRLLSVARGDEAADLLFRGGTVANVFTGKLERADVAVVGDLIAGVGHGYEGKVVVDVAGRVLAPGLIDAHVHIESSLATPPQFARAVLPRGTTTVISDPHEIANVHGLEGIRFMLDASEGLPLSVFVMASSCVPATHMGTAGANLSADDLRPLLDHPRVLGLAELMNFPGAILGAPEVMAKLAAFEGRVIDGHAPGVSGSALNAYVAAGIQSDHECTTAEEAREKLARGLFVFFREATNARNLEALLPALTQATSRRIALCTDDRQPPDLLAVGGIDHMVRRVIASGFDPIMALRLATLNPAEYFGLRDRGGISPGRRADLMVLSDLPTLLIDQVFAGGRSVATEGRCHWVPGVAPPPPKPSMSVDLEALDLVIEDMGGETVRVIEVIPNQIVTGHSLRSPTVESGIVVADPGRDLLKIAVVERHRGTGNVGLGLVSGIGLQSGAIAGTVAHDHHNIIAIGVDDESMSTAIRSVTGMGGGLSVADGGTVVATMPLLVGGLMSELPIEEIRDQLEGLLRASYALGTDLHDPFMAMAFLGLEVIPALKLTDQGLVDVERFEKVGLWA
jgi:adenine deaminase